MGTDKSKRRNEIWRGILAFSSTIQEIVSKSLSGNPSGALRHDRNICWSRGTKSVHPENPL